MRPNEEVAIAVNPKASHPALRWTARDRQAPAHARKGQGQSHGQGPMVGDAGADGRDRWQVLTIFHSRET